MEVHLETQVADLVVSCGLSDQKKPKKDRLQSVRSFRPVSRFAYGRPIRLVDFDQIQEIYTFLPLQWHSSHGYYSIQGDYFFPFFIWIFANWDNSKPHFSDTSEIIPKPHCQIFFIKIMLKSPPECQACKFTLSSSCYRL